MIGGWDRGVIVAERKKGGLHEKDDGEMMKMVRTVFWGWWSAEHRRPPVPCRHWRDEPRQHSTLTEPVNQRYECADHERGQATPGLVSPARHGKTCARTCAYLLVEHRPDETWILLSYLMTSCTPMTLALHSNELGNLPQSFNREQRRLCRFRISRSRARIIRQAGRNRSMLAIRHANDEVGIGPSADLEEVDAVYVHGMRQMRHRYPFHTWRVKGGR